MFIKPIKLDNQNCKKPAFKSTRIPSQELAKIVSEKQRGTIAELEKTFNKKEIEGFFLTGFLNRRGDSWEAVEGNCKKLIDVYREPSLKEKLMGLYCHYILRF